jgi:hypothetical protein
MVIAALALVVTAVGQAAAQGRPALEPGPLEYISRGDRRVIRTQVELGMRLAEMAQERLKRGAAVEELQQAQALARKSYVFLRYAMHGVDIMVNHGGLKVYESQLARMALTAINQAREHNLAAQRAIDNSIPSAEIRDEHVSLAVRELGEAIPVARRAVLLLR